MEVPSTSETTCLAQATSDKGMTWRTQRFPIKQCFDPWTVFLDDGSALVAMLGSLGTPENNLYVYRSPDGGATWPTPPVMLGRGHDHPTLIARADDVYVVSGRALLPVTKQSRDAIHVAHSSDGGRTFGAPQHQIVSNLIYEAHSPALLADGTLVVSLGDHTRRDLPGRLPASRLATPREWVIRSQSGVQGFSEPLFVSDGFKRGRGWQIRRTGCFGSRSQNRWMK
jgi:hypothetical protein